MEAHIHAALTEAIREKDETRRNALRLLLTAMKTKEKELRRALTDDEVRQVIASQVKQRKDSAEQYRAGNRPELAEVEEREIAVLQGFLPEGLTPEELSALVEAAVIESGAKTPAEMGKVMKILVPKVGGRADGKEVSALVRARLGL